MKTVTTKKSKMPKRCHVPYPNAATKQQVLDQFVELLLAAAIGISSAAIVLFILAIA